MIQQLHVRTTSLDSDAETQERIEHVLASAPMTALVETLAPYGLAVESEPIVCKYMDEHHLRLMFPVTGREIEPGCVVSVVSLYDYVRGRTLYAHAMHAGPDVNPLLKHMDGPMANPKAQSGDDGVRATQRLIQHKIALWDRYLGERETLGNAEASRKWRASYYWALKRLYYCTRCTPCRWGSPYFDGPDASAAAKPVSFTHVTTPSHSLNGQTDVVSAVVASDAWAVEVAYAARGGFCVSDRPRLVTNIGSGCVQLVFETDARLLQAGTLVALAVTYDVSRERVVAAHCLSAGADPEIQFLRGDVSLGMPPPRAGSAAESARAEYTSWRRDAWSRFWLDDLETGIAVASENWIDGFWVALEQLFGGNDVSRSPLENRRPEVASPNDNGTSSIPVASILAIGDKCFAGLATAEGGNELRASGVSALMVNLGRRCNQTCRHCHIDAGPHRTEEMSLETVEMVLDVLRRHRIETLDITGGAPEMNPHFRYLVSAARGLVSRIVDRCNLTILFEPGYEDLAEFLVENAVEITASLPCYEEQNVDHQRGNGTFQKSIAALKQLNELGYGHPNSGLVLNLIYNPIGTGLAPPEAALEESYKRELFERFGITFDRLFAMNNMPINRFRRDLARNGKLPDYVGRVVDAFNPRTIDGLMCRHMVSISWEGYLHDCDFNQALDMPLADRLPRHIRDFDLAVVQDRVIRTGPHCFSCAAGAGSSCSGALTAPVQVGVCTEQGH